MRAIAVLIAILLMSVTASPLAGQTPPSSSVATSSSAEDAEPEEVSGEPLPASNLPVSIDRIRERLAAPAPERALLDSLDVKPDFRVEIVERQTILDILQKLDFRTGPAPPGGLYGYEQQRRLFNPVDHPLAQPYAAFSGGELLTIALENLMIRYLGGRLLDAVTDAERARAEAAARAEVTRAIADYCAARPDRATIPICAPPAAPAAGTAPEEAR
jgi:hypothetical protein